MQYVIKSFESSVIVIFNPPIMDVLTCKDNNKNCIIRHQMCYLFKQIMFFEIVLDPKEKLN